MFGFGHWAAVAWQLILTLAVLALSTAVRRTDVSITALVCGLGGSVSVALLSLATRPATFAVLGVLVAALALGAVRTKGPVQALLACAATFYAAVFAGAGAAALDLPPHRAALVLLAVPALTAVLGAVLRRHPAALPVEITGAAAAWSRCRSRRATGRRWPWSWRCAVSSPPVRPCGRSDARWPATWPSCAS